MNTQEINSASWGDVVESAIADLYRNPSETNKRAKIKKDFLLKCISRSPAMFADTVSVCSEFNIFARKPIQASVLETIEMVYKPIAPVEVIWNL